MGILEVWSNEELPNDIEVVSLEADREDEVVEEIREMLVVEAGLLTAKSDVVATAELCSSGIELSTADVEASNQLLVSEPDDAFSAATAFRAEIVLRGAGREPVMIAYSVHVSSRKLIPLHMLRDSHRSTQSSAVAKGC